MLIRFFVTNFMSFDETTEFSMVAGQGATHPHHVVKNSKRHIPNVLRAALLYGANGSGKSNFVKAIDFAKRFIIRNSLKNIDYKYFKLNPENATKPAKFQFDIKLNDAIYSYGFEFLNNKIQEEYLYEIGEKKDKLIFERRLTAEGKNQLNFENIKFKNKEQTQFLNFIGKGTPHDKLFLTECFRRNAWEEVENIEIIESVFYWFTNGLRIMFPNSEFPIGDADFQNYQNLLVHFNIGIQNLHFEEVDYDTAIENIGDLKDYLNITEGTLVKSKDKNTFFQFIQQNNIEKAYKILSRHQGSDVVFDFEEESDGTKRLFDFLPFLYKKTNRTIIIDEIDRSLHPHLSRALLQYFLEEQKDTEMQMIATTHEASLLDLELMRKDALWFAEKNKTGATELYSLEEFKPRADSEIRKGYLQGRYGAIPFIGNLSSQKW